MKCPICQCLAEKSRKYSDYYCFRGSCADSMEVIFNDKYLYAGFRKNVFGGYIFVFNIDNLDDIGIRAPKDTKKIVLKGNNVYEAANNYKKYRMLA